MRKPQYTSALERDHDRRSQRLPVDVLANDGGIIPHYTLAFQAHSAFFDFGTWHTATEGTARRRLVGVVFQQNEQIPIQTVLLLFATYSPLGVSTMVHYKLPTALRGHTYVNEYRKYYLQYASVFDFVKPSTQFDPDLATIPSNPVRRPRGASREP